MYSLLFISICLFPEKLISQDAVKVLDRVYGLDQTLCNGKKYDYSPPVGARGDQYFLTRAYSDGSVTIRGKCFQGLKLNYDLLNQQLLLLYDDEAGDMNIIEVSQAWLDGFRIGDMNFEFINLEKESRFFQVLGEGPVRILYYWRKNLDVQGSVGSYNLTFTQAEKDSFVLMDGHLKPYRNNRGLVGLFDQGQTQKIKNYLHKNKLNVRNATDQAMAEMITFIGKLR